MNTNTMLRKKLQIVNRHGLHARAADKFVKMAMHYGSQIEIEFKGRQANGKSIMSVMMLGAGKGSEIELIVHGADEKRAMHDLEQLIAERFGEKD